MMDKPPEDESKREQYNEAMNTKQEQKEMIKNRVLEHEQRCIFLKEIKNFFIPFLNEKL